MHNKPRRSPSRRSPNQRSPSRNSPPSPYSPTSEEERTPVLGVVVPPNSNINSHHQPARHEPVRPNSADSNNTTSTYAILGGVMNVVCVLACIIGALLPQKEVPPSFFTSGGAVYFVKSTPTCISQQYTIGFICALGGAVLAVLSGCGTLCKSNKESALQCAQPVCAGLACISAGVAIFCGQAVSDKCGVLFDDSKIGNGGISLIVGTVAAFIMGLCSCVSKETPQSLSTDQQRAPRAHTPLLPHQMPPRAR